MRSAISAALAAAAVLVSGVAHAAGSGTASMGIVSITLIDLNLGDGIAPAFTVDDPSSYVEASLFPSPGDGGNGNFFASDALWYADLDFAASTALGAVAARTGPTGATTSATLLGIGPGSTGAFSRAIPMSGSFTLTPWTQVVFSFSASGVATTTAPQIAGTAQYVWTRVGFELLVAVGDEFDFYDSGRLAYASGSGQTQSFVDTISLSYSHQGAEPITGRFEAFTQVGLDASPPVVPEPGTWLLMAAGLVAVGAGTRRAAQRGDVLAR